ncbi:MAG: MBOAT family O-acyltransferase [Myxococcota bacterium]
MNFVQIEFLWFMSTVFTVYWTLPLLKTTRWSPRKLQGALIVVTSCLFYGWVHPWFLILLFISAINDYFAAIGMERYARYKAYILLWSFVVNLGMLAYFKYFNFFLDNMAAVMTQLGLPHSIHAVSILLPVGISFYTFQTMSYTIDVYRGELKARTDLLDYLVYVTFFPQLVAGPINRGASLLVQVERDRRWNPELILSGLTLAMWGGFKKMVVADTIAPYIDKIFVLENPSGPMVWAACVAFSVQIFADFSGYTDIARGTARMLGFELAENFKTPYLAASAPEFWQRWHISLSFWIRDYLLVPLLGSGAKLTTFRFVWATVVTFVIMGFWHGASWNFVLFGLWHGVWLAAYTLVLRRLPAWTERIPFGRWIAIAFHYTCISIPGSLLFRETHASRIWMYLQKNPFAVGAPEEWIAVKVVVGMTIASATPLILSHFVVKYLLPRIERSEWRLPLQTGSWAVFGMAMFVFYRMSASDFIYFQF